MPNNPFSNALKSGHVLETSARRDALAQLTEGLGERKRVVLVTGESGTGKTALVRDAVARWGSRADTAWVGDTPMSDRILLEAIVRGLKIEPTADAGASELRACLERAMRAAEGQVTVVVVDDAHAIDRRVLDSLCQIVDQAVASHEALEIVLIGEPELEQRLETTPWASHLGVRCHLHPFSQKETRRYLHETINDAGGSGTATFPRDTCREIFKQTRGVPRAVAELASETLSAAHASKRRSVTVELVRAAHGSEVAPPTAESKPAAKSEPKPAAKTESKPAARSESKPAAKSEPKPAAKSESKPAAKSESKPAAKSESKPAAKPESKPAHQEPTKSDRKKTAKPAPRTEPTTPATPAPVEKPVEAPAPTASQDAAEIAPANPRAKSPAEVPELVGGDKAIRDWVGRFIGEDEPRFGAHLIPERQEPDAVAAPLAASAEPICDPEPRADSRPADIPESTANDTRADDATPASTEDFVEPTILRKLPNPRTSRSRARKRTPATALIALAIVGIAAVALLLTPQARQLIAGGGSQQPSTTASLPKPTPKPVTPQPVETPPRASEVADEPARQTSRPPATVRTAPEPEPAPAPEESEPTSAGSSAAQPATRTASTSPDPTPAQAPQTFYTLDLGGQDSWYRAQSEGDRLAAETGLQAWVLSESLESANGHRIILGSFSSHERAQISLDLLKARGLIGDAQIIPLPPRSRRR